MKRYIWSVLALVYIANASDFIVSERGKNIQKTMEKSTKETLEKRTGKRNRNLQFEFIEIKENNVTKSTIIPIEEVDLLAVSRQSIIDNKLNSKDGLLIVFMDEVTELKEFEKSFSLTLKEKLQIGYHVFENNSELSDVALMKSILTSNHAQNIETIKPNWKMQMKKY